MSDKTDDQIMNILASTLYDVEACRVGVSLLNLEKNILKLMEQSFYDAETCSAALKVLKLESRDENKILAFIYSIPEGNNRDTIKKLSIPYFKLNKKKEYQIINLLKKVKYDYYFREPCVKALNLDKKTDEQIQSIIELSDFQENVCRAAIKCFKDEENILLLMERKESENNVCAAGAPFIKWEGKNEDQAMQVMKRGQYNSRLCEIGITHLTTVSNILFIMEKGHYYNSICDIGIPLLKLDQKDTDELFHIMRLSGFNYQICDACIPFLNPSKKNNNGLFQLMNRADFNAFVCMRLLSYSKEEEGVDYESFIIDVIRKTNFQTGVCRIGLPLIKQEISHIYVMESSGYNSDVCEIGVTLLKDEKTIFHVMEMTKFDYKVCEDGVKTLTALKTQAKKPLKKRQ
ncbi:MAG: hypothetical protein WAW11_05315 [Patescibacteria group bacterium]